LLQGSPQWTRGASFVAHPHTCRLTESPSYSYSEVAEFRASLMHLFPFVLVCSISRPSLIKAPSKEVEVTRHCGAKPLPAELSVQGSREKAGV
jgi:hypothetical protein